MVGRRKGGTRRLRVALVAAGMALVALGAALMLVAAACASKTSPSGGPTPGSTGGAAQPPTANLKPPTSIGQGEGQPSALFARKAAGGDGRGIDQPAAVHSAALAQAND